VTRPRRETHVVVDTDVTSWLIDPRPLPQAEAARRIIGGRIQVVSFITVTELRYGALLASWGEFRLRRLERSLADLDVIQTGEAVIARCAELRAQLSRSGHGLGQKIHEADRWVAATALALNLDLVAGDGIFAGVDDLNLQRVSPT